MRALQMSSFYLVAGNALCVVELLGMDLEKQTGRRIATRRLEIG
jgi:hypothetical protein